MQLKKKTHYESVLEFAEAFEVKKYKEDLYDIFKDESDLIKFRFSLINEEVNELLQAVKDKNLVEVIDALADCLYVIYGMYDSFGINADEMINHDVNLLAHDDKHYNIMHLLSTELSDYLATMSCKSNEEQSDQWHAFKSLSKLSFRDLNDQSSKFDIFIDQEMVDYRVGKIDDDRNILSESLLRKNIDDALENLAYLTYDIYAASASFNIDINKAFEIVHQSNMSKLCSSEEEAIATVKAYKAISIENNKYYDSPTYRESNISGKWIIYNKSTSKVLKNINYIPTDFKDLL